MSVHLRGYQRVTPWLGMLVFLLAACTPASPAGTTATTSTATATTPSEVTFQPHIYGPLKGNAPAGWVATSEIEVMRGLPHEDPTTISVYLIPGMTIATALPEIAAGIKVEEIPEPFECLYPGIFDWQCYEFESDKLSIHEYAPRTFGPLAVHVSLADTDRGLVAVILTCLPEEKDQLYKTVHKPILQSLAWDVPAQGASAGIRLVEPPERTTGPPQAGRARLRRRTAWIPRNSAEMADYIRRHDIRIGSVTIIRHGYLVYDETFPVYVVRQND